MTIISSFDLEASGHVETALVPVFSQPIFEAEEYRADLADLNLTETQENELLATLWSIMGTFARLGFEADVCGLIFAEFNTVSAPKPGNGSLIASTKMETHQTHQGDGDSA